MNTTAETKYRHIQKITFLKVISQMSYIEVGQWQTNLSTSILYRFSQLFVFDWIITISTSLSISLSLSHFYWKMLFIISFSPSLMKISLQLKWFSQRSEHSDVKIYVIHQDLWRWEIERKLNVHIFDFRFFKLKTSFLKLTWKMTTFENFDSNI